MWSLFIDSLFRSRKGTVKDLAETIGVGRRTLYNLKSGNFEPQQSTSRLLAAYIELEDGELLNYVKSNFG